MNTNLTIRYLHKAYSYEHINIVNPTIQVRVLSKVINFVWEKKIERMRLKNKKSCGVLFIISNTHKKVYWPMFFLISKLLIIFLEPLTWIVLLLILALFAKSYYQKKRLLIACLVLTIIFSNKFLLDQFAKAWDIHTYPPTNQIYSCAIILGGFASEDDNGKGYFNSSADRFIQALKLQAQHRVSTLLITGGNASLLKSKFREADYVREQLDAFKVPDSLFFIENKSKNTLENAAFTKKLLNDKHLEPPYLLVTSAFHMRRSLYTFKAAGLEVLPYPCDYKAGNSKLTFDDFLPHAGVLSTWNYYIKEAVGYVIYYFKT